LRVCHEGTTDALPTHAGCDDDIFDDGKGPASARQIRTEIHRIGAYDSPIDYCHSYVARSIDFVEAVLKFR
jgi:hypothetical protein